jgi:hypothetical protein
VGISIGLKFTFGDESLGPEKKGLKGIDGRGCPYREKGEKKPLG